MRQIPVSQQVWPVLHFGPGEVQLPDVHVPKRQFGMSSQEFPSVTRPQEPTSVPRLS